MMIETLSRRARRIGRGTKHVVLLIVATLMVMPAATVALDWMPILRSG